MAQFLGGSKSLKTIIYVLDKTFLTKCPQKSVKQDFVKIVFQVTAPIQGQAPNNNGVTILSPITSLTGPASNFSQNPGAPGQLQLLQQPQQITLTTITDKGLQQQQQNQVQQQQQNFQKPQFQSQQQFQHTQPQFQQQHFQQSQQQQLIQTAAPTATQQQHGLTIAPAPQTQQTIQPQVFKPGPTKVGKIFKILLFHIDMPLSW